MHQVTHLGVEDSCKLVDISIYIYEISISIYLVDSRYELTRDLCLALVISTATTHMVTKVPRVPNPQNTLASSCQHGVLSHG